MPSKSSDADFENAIQAYAAGESAELQPTLIADLSVGSESCSEGDPGRQGAEGATGSIAPSARTSCELCC